VPSGTKELFYRPCRDWFSFSLIDPALKRWAIVLTISQ